MHSDFLAIIKTIILMDVIILYEPWNNYTKRRVQHIIGTSIIRLLDEKALQGNTGGGGGVSVHAAKLRHCVSNGAHFADRVVPRAKRGQVQSFGCPRRRRRRCVAARSRLHCRYTRSHGGGVRERSNVTWNTIPRRRPWHAWFRRRSSFWTLQTPPPPVSPTPSKVVHTRANSYL